MTDQPTVVPEGAGVPVPAPAPQTAPPRKPFAKPFLFWLFLFSLPAGIVIETCHIYIHEFAHGLVALATGGRFLGIKLMPFSRRASAMAYADAWSDDHETLVILAGIVVGIAIGIVVARKAFRTSSVVPRLLLFLGAMVFLSELMYALEGFLFPDSEFDGALILQQIPSSVLRWLGVGVLVPAVVLGSAILGRGLFRAWEDIFGELSVGRAIWVIVFLVNPVWWPSVRGPGAGWAMLGCLFLYLTNLIRLVGTRRKTVDSVRPGKLRWWGLGIWASTAVAVVGIVCLYKGIQLGSFWDHVVYEVDPDRKTAAGIMRRYGMGDRYGNNRPLFETKLFVSSPESVQVFSTSGGDFKDLAWLPESTRLLVVTANWLSEVDGRTGQEFLVWQPPWGRAEVAKHGPNGELLIVVRQTEGSDVQRSGVFVYDPRRSEGQFHEAEGGIGNPFFGVSKPVRATVTVAKDLWTITWMDHDAELPRIDPRRGASEDGWFEGFSGERTWWYDAAGWRSGEGARILNNGMARYGAGNDGFFALLEGGGWEVTTPEGKTRKGGPIDTDSVVLLQFYGGIPWVAFRSGEVRKLEEPGTGFRAKFPR
jgi:hypothetical protein